MMESEINGYVKAGLVGVLLAFMGCLVLDFTVGRDKVKESMVEFGRSEIRELKANNREERKKEVTAHEMENGVVCYTYSNVNGGERAGIFCLEVGE